MEEITYDANISQTVIDRCLHFAEAVDLKPEAL